MTGRPGPTEGEKKKKEEEEEEGRGEEEEEEEDGHLCDKKIPLTQEQIEKALLKVTRKHPHLEGFARSRLEGRKARVLVGSEEDSVWWEEEDGPFLDAPLADSYAEVVATTTSRSSTADRVKPPPMPKKWTYSVTEYGG